MPLFLFMSVWVKYGRLLWWRRGISLFIKDNQWNFWWKMLSDVQCGGNECE